MKKSILALILSLISYFGFGQCGPYGISAVRNSCNYVLNLSGAASAHQIVWNLNGIPDTIDRGAAGMTVAGGNGFGAAANQMYPLSVYLDAAGNLYVADVFNYRIQEFPAGSTSATNGITVAGGNGQGSAANQLNYPQAVFVDGSGNIYVADGNNNRIQKFPAGSTSATAGTTVAGGNGQGNAADQLHYPSGIYIDNTGSMYVADQYNQRIQKFPAGSTSATNGTTVAGGNGWGNAANQFEYPTSVYVDQAGNIYVTDDGNLSRVQKFPAGSTSATNGSTIAGGNGPGNAADQLNNPNSVYADQSGNVYVSDGNDRVQKFAAGSTSATSGVTVAGGNGRGASSDQFGSALGEAFGMYVDSLLDIYIADYTNARIQKWPQPPLISLDTSIGVSAPGVYSATVTDTSGCTAHSDTVTLQPLVSAYFTLLPSGTPDVFTGVNQSTGAGIVCHWSWFSGDSIGSNGDTPSHTYSSAGTYQICVSVYDSFGCSANYCDTSLYLSAVNFNPNAATILTQNICPGSTYTFNGAALSVAGTYYDTLTSVTGHDSIVTLFLNIETIPLSHISKNISSGNTYDFNSHILTASGTYYDTLTASTGCDSIVSLSLYINSDLTLMGALNYFHYPYYKTNIFTYRPGDTVFATLDTMGIDSEGWSGCTTLTQAANGKYYVPTWGGTGRYEYGTILEYDPATQRHRIAAYFDSAQGISPFGALMLASDGLLYGMTEEGGTYNTGVVYSFNPVTSTITRLANEPRGSYCIGSLVQGSDGDLYGLTPSYLGTANAPDTPGIFSYHIGSANTSYRFKNMPLLSSFNSALIQVGADTFYGLSPSPYTSASTFVSGYAGSIIRYISTTDSFNVVGLIPYYYVLASPTGSLTLGPDGRLYGVTDADGFDSVGTLFRFDIQTSHYDTLHNFKATPADGTAGIQNSTTLIDASDGNLYGTLLGGGVNLNGTIFQYRPTDSTYSTILSFPASAGGLPEHSTGALTELKPVSHHVVRQPVGVALCHSGDTATFTVADSSTLPTATIWQYSTNGGGTFSILPGSADTILTFVAADSMQGYLYRAIFSSGDTTQAATLAFYPADTFVQHVSICSRDTFYLNGHAYTTPGQYRDTLIAAGVHGCDSIVILSLSLDSVIASFTLQPSSTPHLWYIVNQCIGTALSYSWNWGDNSPNSIGDTPSHTYDTAGYYNVCVTATDNMGCSATYCDTNQYLFKNQSGQMIYVDVVNQIPSGINTIITESLNINYYGNAVHFSEALQAPTQLRLYDLSGRVVMQEDNFSGNVWDIHSDIAQGVYILQLQNGSYSVSKKLMILQ